MQGFVADLLAQQGALVEPIEPEGLEVLAPPPVQQALGGERAVPAGVRRDAACRCASASGSRATGSTGSDRLARRQGRWARLVLRPELRRPRIRNGCWSTRWCWTTRRSGCSTWCRPGPVIWCWISAIPLCPTRSAMACCGLASIWRPARCPTPCWSRSRPGSMRRSADAALPDEAELPPAWERSRLLELVDRALHPRLDAALAPFVKGLRRRLEPRSGAALRRTTTTSIARRRAACPRWPKAIAGRRREEQRSEAIRREYHAKMR